MQNVFFALAIFNCRDIFGLYFYTVYGTTMHHGTANMYRINTTKYLDNEN